MESAFEIDAMSYLSTILLQFWLHPAPLTPSYLLIFLIWEKNPFSAFVLFLSGFSHRVVHLHLDCFLSFFQNGKCWRERKICFRLCVLDLVRATYLLLSSAFLWSLHPALQDSLINPTALKRANRLFCTSLRFRWQFSKMKKQNYIWFTLWHAQGLMFAPSVPTLPFCVCVVLSLLLLRTAWFPWLVLIYFVNFSLSWKIIL